MKCNGIVEISGSLCKQFSGILIPSDHYYDAEGNPIVIFDITKGNTGMEAFGKQLRGDHWHLWRGDIRGNALPPFRDDIAYVKIQEEV